MAKTFDPSIYMSPPVPLDDYDWRKEPWVREATTTDAATAMALRIVAMLAIDEDDPQRKEDLMVLAACNPEMVLDPIVRKPDADEYIRYRLVQAIAQLIDHTGREFARRKTAPAAPASAGESK
jgi:hypothetical protein